MGTTRGTRGRFLALQQAQGGFKLLEIPVTHASVTMFRAWLLVSPNVRMNRVMRPDSVRGSMLAQASLRANRRKRRRVVTGDKVRCCNSALCTCLLRRVRRPKRIAVILRIMSRASALVCLLWCVRRARRFCDGPFMRLVRHVSGKIDRVRRLPWRGSHIVVLPY
jgi:hypothetical protein